MQQSTISVSKGCFVFKNGSTSAGQPPGRSKARRSNTAAAAAPAVSSLLTTAYRSQPWYAAYERAWSHIRQQHDRLQTVNYAHTLAYLRQFVEQCQARSAGVTSGSAGHAHNDDEGDPNLPTTALLTGINQPDHAQLFGTFADIVRREMRSHVCILQSMDCPNMKATIETMVSGLMQRADGNSDGDDDDNGDDDDDDNADAADMKRLRRSQYTMAVLKAWYAHRYPAPQPRPILAVIVPDFENFQRDVLQQFILLLSHNCRLLPIVLVLGVATDLATLHRTLSFADTSRMSLQVSQSQPSTQSLNKILDEIVLTPDCAITLSVKVYILLTDIFLYFDLSINSFMQGFKYCVMEHFNQGNAYALCTAATGSDVRTAVRLLDAAALDTIRRLPSFRRYVESLLDARHVIAVLTDDEALRKQLPGLLRDVRVWLQLWYGVLRVLLAVLQELPRNVTLSRQLRDLYAQCAATAVDDSPALNTAWELLAMLSRDELLGLLKRCAAALEVYAERYCDRHALQLTGGIVAQLRWHADRIRDACQTSVVSPEEMAASAAAATAFSSQTKVQSRAEMQAKVLHMSKQPKTVSAFTAAVTDALRYLRTDVLAVHLRPFGRAPPLFELYRFDDVTAVRSHIMGAPRAALHTALNTPQCYLLCDCCQLDNATQMRPGLPDLSIVYKLHLESGHMINLFDWMQAFRAVVEPDEEGTDENVEPISPQLQARFTRAVAELQFLGFIKGSKRKTDHVARLTW